MTLTATLLPSGSDSAVAARLPRRTSRDEHQDLAYGKLLQAMDDYHAIARAHPVADSLHAYKLQSAFAALSTAHKAFLAATALVRHHSVHGD